MAVDSAILSISLAQQRVSSKWAMPDWVGFSAGFEF
jgi:hypothetical protein